MSTLVLGASGQVGQHLMNALRASGRDVYGTCWKHHVEGLRAHTVYVAAALSHVDYCESHPDDSYAINVAPIELLASTGVRIVFFSTEYVFAGNAGPYRETDPVAPLNVYGEHKVRAELALPEAALIIRTTVVYGAESQRKNFIYRVIDTLRSGRELRVPDDQVGSPTYAPILARAAVCLEEQGAHGTYNVAGDTRVSRYEFAREAARVFQLDADLVRPVSTDDLRQPARRPLDAGLVTEKAQSVLGFPLIGYCDGLRAFCAETAVAL